uniref:Uncharacterized protein n=1 Tax=Acrobeloides nanus TaxID=290746 RepID=A0A914CJ84_9BILA
MNSEEVHKVVLLILTFILFIMIVVLIVAIWRRKRKYKAQRYVEYYVPNTVQTQSGNHTNQRNDQGGGGIDNGGNDASRGYDQGGGGSFDPCEMMIA